MILASIGKQPTTPELAAVVAAMTKQSLEGLYLPYKQKRRGTRAKPASKRWPTLFADPTLTPETEAAVVNPQQEPGQRGTIRKRRRRAPDDGTLQRGCGAAGQAAGLLNDYALLVSAVVAGRRWRKVSRLVRLPRSGPDRALALAPRWTQGNIRLSIKTDQELRDPPETALRRHGRHHFDRDRATPPNGCWNRTLGLAGEARCTSKAN